MDKRGLLILFIFSFMLVFSLYGIVAQENSEENFALEASAGTTPESALYFLDKFFDRFGDDLKVKEERIAEIREMILSGNFEAARIALEGYKEQAEKLEKEISPEMSEEAKRSAAAIKSTLEELEAELSEEERAEFVDFVNEKEDTILTSVEIAAKIKELCESLSRIDPLEYSRVCKTQDDAPEWQKNLDKDLTSEQRAEAEKFGEIMSECFRTSGQQCRCSEIPFTEFANTCSIAAPLAVACDIDGNEAACEKLDNLEMPELPEHLQSVFDRMERDISGAQFELHMPKECREAGVTNPRDCSRIMIQTHAPEECRQELLDANVQNEREAREICEKIMFEQNAPQECIDQGIRDHKECGKLMFKINAPQECIDAGLTGENRNDPRKCEEIMRGLDRSGPNRGHEGGFGVNCRAIQNPEERLKCYDGAIGQTQNFDERFRETKEAERQCAESCLSKGGAWDFSNGNCQCHFQEFDDSQFNEEFRNDFASSSEGFSGASPDESCAQAGGSWDGSTCLFPQSPEPSTSTEGQTTEESSAISGSETSSPEATTETGTGTSGTDSGTTGATISDFDEKEISVSPGKEFCEYMFGKEFCGGLLSR